MFASVHGNCSDLAVVGAVAVVAVDERVRATVVSVGTAQKLVLFASGGHRHLKEKMLFTVLCLVSLLMSERVVQRLLHV